MNEADPGSLPGKQLWRYIGWFVIGWLGAAVVLILLRIVFLGGVLAPPIGAALVVYRFVGDMRREPTEYERNWLVKASFGVIVAVGVVMAAIGFAAGQLEITAHNWIGWIVLLVSLAITYGLLWLPYRYLPPKLLAKRLGA